ncbi:MAG: hypothetical protein ACRDY7_04670 [Acidimicrobiia bacterium]
MLQVTNSAVSALASARTQTGLPDHFGVRIFASGSPNSDTQPGYQLGFVEEPETNDQVAEVEGTRVFVAPEVADSLDNAVLDTGDSGRLILAPRSA